MENETAQSQTQITETNKKPFHPPQFEDRGTVRELALGSGEGELDDGGGTVYSQ